MATASDPSALLRMLTGFPDMGGELSSSASTAGCSRSQAWATPPPITMVEMSRTPETINAARATPAPAALNMDSASASPPRASSAISLAVCCLPVASANNVAMERPDASVSKCPLRPQVHSLSPNPGMCPISAAAPVSPVCRAESRTRPPPTPVPNAIPKKLGKNRPAPKRCSPRTNAATSFPARTGIPRLRLSSSPSA